VNVWHCQRVVPSLEEDRPLYLYDGKSHTKSHESKDCQREQEMPKARIAVLLLGLVVYGLSRGTSQFKTMGP
jgi:hypothetical protein